MKQLSLFDVLEVPTEPIEECLSKIKYPEKRYLTEKHFDESQTNLVFVAYLHAFRKQIGDEYRLSDMQKWVDIEVVKFKKANGLHENDMLSNIENYHAKFTEFLKVNEVTQ